MKLRSGKQTLEESDSKKRSAKVSKMKKKRKKSFDGVNFIGFETAHRSLKEDGDEGCLRPMAVAASSVVSKAAVLKHGQGSTLPNAVTDESSASSDIAITNDSTYFHQTSSNVMPIYSDCDSHTDIGALSSIRLSCSAKMSPSDGSNVRSTLQVCSPIIIDVTNIRSEKKKCKMNMCSAIDSTTDKISKCVEVVYEVNNSILKNPSVKQGDRGILVETVSQKINDSFKVLKHNNQGSTQEDDSCSVISLGSDSEVIILDIDPEPQSDCSSTSDVVVIDTVSSAKDVPTSDIVSVGPGTLSRQSNRFQSRECATRKSIGRDARKMRKTIKQKLKAVHKEDVSLLRNVLQTVQNKPNGLTSVRNHNVRPGIVPYAAAAAVSSNFAPASNFGVGWMQSHTFTAISSTVGYNQMHVTSALSAGVQGSGLHHRNNNAVRVGLQPISNQVDLTSVPFASLYGTNLYNPNPNPVRSGLRPIIIDGSNVAMGHSNGRIFSCRGLKICIDYFLKRWHKVVAFVPQFRKSSFHSLDTKILDDLEKQGLVSFTPSRKIGNRLVVPYDDRYIVQYAAECGGVIVSTDNYRDLLKENPAWRETIESRLLMFTWVGDVLMFPQDPLGRYGPNLDRFLRFP